MNIVRQSICGIIIHLAPWHPQSKSHTCALPATSSARSSPQNTHPRDLESLASSSHLTSGHQHSHQILLSAIFSEIPVCRLDESSKPCRSSAADPCCLHLRTGYTAAAKAPPRFRKVVCFQDTQRTGIHLAVGLQICLGQQCQDSRDEIAASARNAATRT